MEIAFSGINFINKSKHDVVIDLKKLSLLELCKLGKLDDFIDEGNSIKFGMLKKVYKEANTYKKSREYKKGIAKFLLRFVPILLSPIFFPIWLISQILGTTRAFNKILIPAFKIGRKNYNSFLMSIINIAEGDIKPLLGNDWYYDAFFVHDGLINMVRKEHLYEFTDFICIEIEKKDDDQIVPYYWLDDQFRIWLNNKFNLDLPIGKEMIKHK
jgi:hypothetical protein